MRVCIPETGPHMSTCLRFCVAYSTPIAEMLEMFQSPNKQYILQIVTVSTYKIFPMKIVSTNNAKILRKDKQGGAEQRQAQTELCWLAS